MVTQEVWPAWLLQTQNSELRCIIARALSKKQCKNEDFSGNINRMAQLQC